MPTAPEVIVHTLAGAYEVLRIANGTGLVRPPRKFDVSIRSIWNDGFGPHRNVFAAEIRDAEAVIRAFERLGAAPAGSKFDPIKDKAVLDCAAEHFSKTGTVNDCAIARQVGLSHTQVGERRVARCHRIMAALRQAMPKSYFRDSPSGKIWRPVKADRHREAA
jgi:hypothetical protein